MDTIITSKYQSKLLRTTPAFLKDIRQGRFGSECALPKENDLAEIYGVSRPTVRRMISMLEQEGVLSREPRKGVWIKNIKTSRPGANYKSTQSSFGNNKYCIAAVWAAFVDDMTNRISNGINAYAQQHNLDFHIYVSEKGHEHALDVLDHIEEYCTDGAIIIPYETPEYVRSVQRLVAKRFPLVCVDRPIRGLDTCTVEVDSAQGMYQATTRLLMKYHRPVYYLGVEPMVVRTQQMRYEGYRRAMADAGFEDLIHAMTWTCPAADNDPNFWPLEKSWQRAYKTALNLLATVQFPISMIAMNDYTAHGIYEAAKELELKIGEDIKLFSFDDFPLAYCLNPTLSSVSQPREQVGYEAAKLLHQLITGQITHPISRVLPVELSEKQSS